MEGEQAGKQQSSLQSASGHERGALLLLWSAGVSGGRGLLQRVVFQEVPGPGDPADTGPSALHWPLVGPLLERQVVEFTGERSAW